MVLEQLQSDEPIVGMRGDVRKLYTAGALYACGVLECWRDSSRALDYAEQLTKLDMGMYEMSADQLRMLYYANQGELQLSRQYRQRVEMHAIQRGSAWQVETWAPGAFIGVHLRTNDALSMKRGLEDLRRLSEEIPSLKTYVRRSTGSYLLLRGKHAEASIALDECLRQEPPCLVGSARTQGSLACAYNGLGEHARAREVCEQALSRLEPEDLAFTALNISLQIEHALALAGLGEHAVAARELDALLSQHAGNAGPLTMGALTEARARVALMAGDRALAADCLVKMESWYHPTGIPSLMQRCAQLARELRMRGHEVIAGPHDDQSSERLFSESMDVTQCARHALTLFAPDAPECYLFLSDVDGVKLLASSRDRPASDALFNWVEGRLQAAQGSQNTVVLEDQASIDQANLLSLGDKTYRIGVLYASDAYRDIAIGAIVMPLAAGLALPSGSALHALAMQLQWAMAMQ